MNNPKTTSFEEKVYMATRVPGPSPEFAEHLWKQVVEQPQKQSGFNTHFPRIFARPVWAASTIVLLVTVVLITTLGPGQVWAAVQKLIGYIPGIGFVENNEATLILSQPVTNTRGQVSVTVVNAVASIDNTRIILQADGLNGLRKYVQDNRPEILRLAPSVATGWFFHTFEEHQRRICKRICRRSSDEFPTPLYRSERGDFGFHADTRCAGRICAGKLADLARFSSRQHQRAHYNRQRAQLYERNG